MRTLWVGATRKPGRELSGGRGTFMCKVRMGKLQMLPKHPEQWMSGRCTLRARMNAWEIADRVCLGTSQRCSQESELSKYMEVGLRVGEG